MSEQIRRLFSRKIVFDWDFYKKEDLLQIGTDCVTFDD